MNTDAMHILVDVINQAAHPLQEHNESYTHLIDKIGEARFVLIGEASHGTHEFYQTRIEITKRLIEQKGFMAVAIEGDWPDAHRIHRYVQGLAHDSLASLNGFKRFPTWMWRNTTMPPFLEWLRDYNDRLAKPAEKIGFYGLDLYSLHTSMQAVIQFLKKIDPTAAKRAQERYACFDHIAVDPHMYGYLINSGIKKPCINEAIAELMELQQHAYEYMQRDGIAAEDDYFFATQNARLVKNAEHYYRTILEGEVSSWNIRDTHMAETLNVLADHLETRFKQPAKIIVWAHNSHVGDARATEMGERNEVNLGQLVREVHDTHVYNIGFSTYSGSVTAANNWDEPAQRKEVMPGLQGSYEDLFHKVKYKNFLLNLSDHPELEHYLKIPRLQRAIGVIYRPDTERFSHYFFTHLPYQFNSMIHLDTTTAVQEI